MSILECLLKKERRVGVVGLGYVGLPLACLFARSGFAVAGYDVSHEKVLNLTNGSDPTKQVDSIPPGMLFSSDPEILQTCDLILICVPTPKLAGSESRINLSYIEQASKTVAANLSKGAIVCYESSVYPGLTEDLMRRFYSDLPLKLGVDFNVGYSPERINPGDTVNTLDKINKLVSGDTSETAKTLAEIYSKVLKAKVHICPSIKVAEIAKLHENIQRAMLIAHANELSLHCKELGIEASDVIEACSTKWNFVPAKPGFVSGDCLPVNPTYYIETEKDFRLGLVREVRDVNTNMPRWVASIIRRKLEESGVKPTQASVAILGVAYKENIGDFRESGAVKLLYALYDEEHLKNVYMIDDRVNKDLCEKHYNAPVFDLSEMEDGSLNAVVVATAHDEYKTEEFADEILRRLDFSKKPWIFDLKGILSTKRLQESGREFGYWKL